MDQEFHIADLIHKKIKGEISSEEEKDLQAWLNLDPRNSSLFERISDSPTLLSKLDVYQLFEKDKVWSSLEDKLFEPKVVPLFRRKFFRYAASILLPLLLAGTYYMLDFSEDTSLAGIDEVIKVGEQKATLILSNGEELDLLDKTANSVIQQGETRITNREEALTYVSELESTADQPDSTPQQLSFNELVTPRGGGYKLTLSDGTEVWLNAASSLKFPVAFTDSTRMVFLEGEAFFDVRHTGKPFIVNGKEMEIRVLGTSFNASSYQEEPDSRTTLVDGSVQLTAFGKRKILRPEEQGVIAKDGTEIRVEQVNTDPYTSWVNGKIEFSQQDLDGVMRRLARWYDFEYVFENEEARNYHFTARIDNTQKISTILEMLELTTKVKFERRGKTIVIR